jgi:hypothetical protein
MPPQRERPVSVISESIEIADQSASHAQFRRHLQDRPDLRLLQEEALRRGYQPQDRPEETFSIRVRSRASGDVHPPRGATGEPVQEVEFELVGQSVSKADAEGAVATVTIRAGGNYTQQHIFIEAERGNFVQAVESTVENGQVVYTNSWWSAWIGCLYRDCASTCLISLWSCSGTWAAYFWCVAARCGGCVVKCAACATCDCSWWCRWAAGCCSQ